MPRRRRLPALMLGALGLIAAAGGAATAQTGGWSPWGGPDSPGGLFGGDPASVEPVQNRFVPATQDQLWAWVGTRLGLPGAPPPSDARGGYTAEQLGIPPNDSRRNAWFRAADRDGNGRLSTQELRDHTEYVFRFHDANRDGRLDATEIRRQPAAAAPSR